MFWKLRILVKLRFSAQSWSTLFDTFSNNARLYNALKYLCSHGYIERHDDNSYSLTSRASLREYIAHRVRWFVSLVGFFGGILAIIQFFT